ncbi:MAG: hypothetical protein HY862_01450 [Chloroflexi bacterium]|nr:hypothetical protein [Chloroflexota bacterium]
MRKTYCLARWLIVMLVALSFWASYPHAVIAQDDGESDKIVSSRALVVMPSVIRFRVRVAATMEQVAEIKLTVQDEDTVLQTYDITSPADNIFINFGDESEYEIVWDIREVPLHPFSTLTYQFEVQMTDGEIATVKNDFIFQHETVQQWQLAESDTLKIYAMGDAIDWSNHLAGLEQSISLLRENTGFIAPIGLVVYPEGTEFCTQGEVPTDTPDATPPMIVISEDRAYPCDPADMTRFYAFENLVIAYASPSDFYTEESQAFAPIFDLAYSTRWGNADVPAWFTAGLRQLYNRVNQGQKITTVKRASQESRMLSLTQMETPAADANSVLWEAQAYSLTLYLADVYGASTPFDIAKAISPSLSANQAIEERTGQIKSRLYARWLVWLDTPQAIAAGGWNPYLATTPTPLPSNTPSQIPPTHTPRPTATITLTPTSTYRGDFVPTVFKPTDVLPTIARNSTNTPLPPGGLNPTPTPRPASNEQDESSGLCGTGIGAILLPTFGIVWVQQKRRKQAANS